MKQRADWLVTDIVPPSADFEVGRTRNGSIECTLAVEPYRGRARHFQPFADHRHFRRRQQASSRGLLCLPVGLVREVLRERD